MRKVYLRSEVFLHIVEYRRTAQRKLALRLGISPGHFSLLINRKRSVGARIRQQLMDRLGLDYDTLFEATDSPTVEGASNPNQCPDAGQAGQNPSEGCVVESSRDNEKEPS